MGLLYAYHRRLYDLYLSICQFLHLILSIIKARVYSPKYTRRYPD